MSDPLWTIIEVLLPAVLALAGAALYLGAAYLKRKAEAIQDERLRDEAIELIGRVRVDVDDAVSAVAQQYVDDIKAARQDGKLTEAEKAEARRRALEKIRKRLSSTAERELASLVGNVAEWLEDQIEAAVRRLKDG